jgi:hypothetical protein
MVGASGSPSAPTRGPTVDVVLMVGAPGSTALAPPRESVVDVFYVDGGCFRISISTRQGPRCRHSVDGGRYRNNSSDTSQGDRRRRFLALMVGTPRSTAPAPLRESTIDVFYIDGGCSWISVSTRQGPRRRCFLR